jgi:predicted CoA-binding protein
MRPRRRFSHSRHGHFYRRATRRRTGVRLCSHVSQTTDSQTFWIQLNLHEASVMQKRKPLRYAILANACVGKRSE